MLPFQFLPLASDPDADKIVVWENVLLDNLFSSPKQIRWSAGYPGGVWAGYGGEVARRGTL